MKKILIILTLALFSMGAFSQLKFGVKGGMNYTFPSYTVSADSIDKPKTSGIGTVVGFFCDIPLSETFFFMPEANLSFRYYNSVVETKSETSGFSSLTEVYGYHKLAYLEVPLLFKLNMEINTGKYGRNNFLGLYAGPVFGLQLAKGFVGETVSTITVYDQTTVAKTEFSETDVDYKPFDLAISAGAMYDFEKGARIGLRFLRSLAAVNNNEGYSINHNVLQLTFGYNFIKQ